MVRRPGIPPAVGQALTARGTDRICLSAPAAMSVRSRAHINRYRSHFVDPEPPSVDIAVVAAVAALGFYEDPVMAWVFPNRATRLESLNASFTSLARRFLARAGRVDLFEEACAALWLGPDPPELEGEILPAKDTWHLFTPDVTERFTALGAAMEAAHPQTPHWYLGVVATTPDRQGEGLGARILRPVIDQCDREGWPAYLESSNARNLPFYYRLGWVQTGEITIPDGPTLYPMWREPR